jgi:glutamine synthetase
MNNIIPVASKYESVLLDKAFKRKELGLNYDSDIELIRDIQNHTSAIQRLVGEMVEARKVANRVEDQREKAILYHDTVAIYLDEIRQHIDRLEEVIDDQLWPLPKYRELLFIR